MSWSNYYTCSDGIVKDSYQRVGIALTCTDISKDEDNSIYRLIYEFEYHLFNIKIDVEENEKMVIESLNSFMSHIEKASDIVILLTINIAVSDIPVEYIHQMISIVSKNCVSVLISFNTQMQFPNELYTQCHTINSIIQDVNAQLKCDDSTTNSVKKLNNKTNQIGLGLTTSSVPSMNGGSNVSSAEKLMLNQRNIQLIIDTLEDRFAQPVSLNCVQLPIRNASSDEPFIGEDSHDKNAKANPAPVNPNNNTPSNGNSIQLPNFSTRLIEFIHSRGVNGVIELDTIDYYMSMYKVEFDRLKKLDDLYHEIDKKNVKKKSTQDIVGGSGNEAEKLFNLYNFLKPYSEKYKKHVYLILIKCYLQLGCLVIIPYKYLFKTTSVPKIEKLEMPPITELPKTELQLMAMKKKKDNENESNNGENTKSSDTLRPTPAKMETVTYASLVSSILHPFVYRKEYVSPTNIMKFMITQEEMSDIVAQSEELEAVQDNDIFFHDLGNLQPERRKLKY